MIVNNNNNKIDKNIIMNNKSDLNESKLLNNNNITNNNTNILNNSGSILNNNIFNNKLLLSFKQKEKDLKYFETFQELNKENESNNKTNNNNNNNFNDSNGQNLNYSEKEESEKKDKTNINVKIRNEYGDLFKLNNLTSDPKIKTIKSDNNFSEWKENESNFYKEQEERVEEENVINEELRERFRLKEVVLKFILTDEEYNLLIQEKAKTINPFKY